MINTNTPPVDFEDDTGRLSDHCRFWRMNRSHHEATELAFVLKALRKVTSFIGTNVKPVNWAGMGDSDKKRSILLSSDEIYGTYPVPFHKMDILVGQVVREAFSGIEWGEWVRDRVYERLSITAAEKIDYLVGVIAAGEDIYVSERPKSRIWSLYLTNYWKYLDHQTVRDLSLPPTASSLSNVWRAMTLLKKKPDDLHRYYEAPLRILSVYTDAIKIAATLSSVAQRRNSRVEIYLRIWELVDEAISEWEVFDIPPDAVPIRDESGPKGKTEEPEEVKEDEGPEDIEEEQAGERLDADIASEISSILEEGETDLTAEIAVVVEEPEAKEMNTTFTRASAESNVIPDPQQVRQLRRIFKKQRSLHRKLRKKRVKRNLDQGKLDARRLHRVPLGGKIFKAKINSMPDEAWNITIVSDASASMSGQHSRRRPWDSAEKAFVSLAEATRGFKNHLEVYGYHENNGECILTQLYQSGKFFTMAPGGRTPSGQAITAAALLLKDRSKKSLMIHITDGAANCGINVASALEYCKKSGIDLITIGCGCNQQTRRFLQARHAHGQLLLMDDIRDLPTGLERLFRHKLLLRS